MQHARQLEIVAWPNPLRRMADAIERMNIRRDQRRTAQALRALGGNTLKDLGIYRSEIDSVVYGAPGERRLGYRENDK